MLNLSAFHPEAIKQVIEKIPVIDLVPLMWDAYQSMTPQEKAEFIKNAMITGARIGAAVA